MHQLHWSSSSGFSRGFFFHLTLLQSVILYTSPRLVNSLLRQSIKHQSLPNIRSSVFLIFQEIKNNITLLSLSIKIPFWCIKNIFVKIFFLYNWTDRWALLLFNHPTVHIRQDLLLWSEIHGILIADCCYTRPIKVLAPFRSQNNGCPAHK